MEAIMKAAGWSRQTTFTRFYCKLVATDRSKKKFWQALLDFFLCVCRYNVVIWVELMNIAVTENVSIVTTYRVPFKDSRDT